MGSKERILEAIKQNRNATYAELAQASGLSITTVVYHMRKMIDSGVIRQGRKWEIL